MLTQLIRWFKGYLKIRLIGYSPERFLNICKSKNIFVWNLKSHNNHYEMFILLKDFKKLKPLCKKTVSKVRIIEKVGYPFFVYNLRNKKMFVIGMILSFAVIYLSSFHLWNIEINGNNKITQDIVLSFLEQEKINPGILLSKLNCKDIAANMRNHFNEIIWVSVSLEGTCMHIELRENTDSILTHNIDKSPTDLIAKYDGIITHIVTRSGVPMVKEGSVVSKGDILVSGSIPVLNDNKEIISTNYVKADADILGERIITYQDKLDSTHLIKKYSKSSTYFEIGPIKKQIKNKNNLEIFIENNLIHLGTIKEYEWIESSYTQDERAAILNNNYNKFYERLIADDVVILDSNLKIEHYEKYSVATSILRLEQAMEESRKIIDLSSDNMLQ